MRPIPIDRLEGVAAESMPPPSSETAAPNGANTGANGRQGGFHLETFIALHLEVRTGPTAWGDGQKWILAKCPFDSAHTGTSAVITRGRNGAIGFRCQHASCAERHWKDVRELFDGPQDQRKQEQKGSEPHEPPKVMPLAELLQLDTPAPEQLIENFLPRCGASLVTGMQKSGKTLLGIQAAVAVSTGNAMLDYYTVRTKGAVMIIEQDDPDGAASVKEILKRADAPKDAAIYFVPRVPFPLGPAFVAWLEGQIRALGLVMVVLDSYTALRGSRGSGSDIVKLEAGEMGMLDELGKRANCLIVLLHHESKGSAALDWSQRGGGSFAMTAATESLTSVSRFAELGMGSPERLIRIRGRHLEDREMVLRFRKETLDYEFVLEGGAASMYPLVVQIKQEFGTQAFTPKALCGATGISRATAHRHIAQLLRAEALTKVAYGEYVLAASIS